ncbi:MAG: N-acetylmuramoyl-L-alanine amidase [Hyphomicrobiales bacterium]
MIRFLPPLRLRLRLRPRVTTLAVLAAALLGACLAVLPALAQRGTAAIRVVYPDPRPAERITPIVVDNVRYVSTDDLARVLSATKYWRPEIRKLSLRIGERTIRFTVDAPVVLFDEDATNLVEPVRLLNGVVYVPESIIGLLFEWGITDNAVWDEATRTIRFRSQVHSVRQAQLFVRGNVTEVAATLTKSLPARVLYATPNEICVLFEGGTLDTAEVFQGGIVTGGEIRELPSGVELRLAMADGARGYQISVGSNRFRVSVTAEGGLVDAGIFLPLEPIKLGGADGVVRTIVIDPGHGGSDLGAALPGGVAEKDVALDIARSLRSALQASLGARVILTRDGDADLTESRRAEIANEQRADLFISIHLDPDGEIKGGGFRVFTQSPVVPPSDAMPALLLPGGDDTEMRPWRTAQLGEVGASMALAQSVVDALTRTFPQSPVLSETGRMSVLEPVLCPAILLESAPAARTGPEAMSLRGYTIYDYTQTIAHAVEDFVRRSRA